ncbi:MAG: peptide chain release factor N(5)-glutamine methyltransferase [Candidatus Omnitrophica bacterium]|nr:peptide chain release factor N(5)-glutamine methyltransferase [Candidatus Omnitrophota bacterium]
MTEDELFLTAILNCSRSALYVNPQVLSADQQKRLDKMRNQRRLGEPVQYITGFTEFFGHRFEVGPGVLIPRPETEVLADVLIRALKAQDRKAYFILDIGTGSGCLAVTLVKELPNCRAVALDVSSDALNYARRNAEINGVMERIEFVERDVFWFMDETLHRFDAVVSNPPYIPTCSMHHLPIDVKHEPELALEGGADGLHFYRYIAPASRKVLKSGGVLAVEHGDGQSKELQNLFAITAGWDKIQSFKDNAGRSRIVMAQKSNS